MAVVGARWMERFVFFGFGVFCTITIFYIHHVHTSSSKTQQQQHHQESSSFQPPNQLQSLYQQQQQKGRRKEKEFSINNVQWSRQNKNENDNNNDNGTGQSTIISNVRLEGSIGKVITDDTRNKVINNNKDQNKGLTSEQKSNLGITARIEKVPIDPKIFETIQQKNHTTTTTKNIDF